MFIEAFLFGVTIAIAIGPIALLIVNASFNRGVGAGLACGAGAAAADFTFALGGFLAGSAALGLLDANRDIITTFAALFLCGLGVWMLWLAWRDRAKMPAPNVVRGPGFLATYLLTLANPLTILFFAAWLGSHRKAVTPAESVSLAIAIFVGSLLVQSGLALSGGALRPLLSRPGTLLGANLASGGAIFAIGVYQFVQP